MPTAVVKLGSSVVADERGGARIDVVRHVCLELARAYRRGTQVVLVTSGAVARGMRAMRLPARPAAMDELQAASAVGQGRLFRVYEELLREHGIEAAQVLLTMFDLSIRRHYLNAKGTLERLIDWRVVPVINENDTTATDEITFGDNDFLAAHVAVLLSADLLLLLTDIDGVYTADPREASSVRLIPTVTDLAALAEAAEIGSGTSALGSGGMRSKTLAAEIAGAAGIPTVVANGTRGESVARALAGEPVGTRFEPVPGRRAPSFELWLQHAKPTRGALVVGDGAVRAVREDAASVLPLGVVDVRGDFQIGDAVELVLEGAAERVVGKGIVNFSATELRRVRGMASEEVQDMLPGASEEAMSRDQLVMND
jgi:glutamate 5-kinase